MYPRDRQIFEERRLPNGLLSHVYREDAAAYVCAAVTFPVGSAHNTGRIPQGGFHFMEHAMMQRSKAYPGRHGFAEWLGLRGGYINAHTGSFDTQFVFNVPALHWEEACRGFVSLLTETIFEEEDLALERSIVRSERAENERWYPGEDEIGQYLFTKWQHDCPMPIRQRYGDASDLEAMTPDVLRSLRAAYFDPRAWVLVAGGGDPAFLLDALGAVPLQDNGIAEEAYTPLGWVRPEYHTRAFRDLAQFELRYAGIHVPRPDFATIRALNFAGEYLTNAVHGPLYQWLRKEQGWIYGVDSYRSTGPRSYDWSMKFAFSSMERVEAVRAELPGRIERALDDHARVAAEVERILGENAYLYERIFSIFEEAEFTLGMYGRIISEREWNECITRLREPGLLARIWREHVTPANTGWLCTTPEAET